MNKETNNSAKPTKGEWSIRETRDKEYPNHIDYSIHCETIQLHANPDDTTSPLWEFTPYIADIKFGRTNEEREVNAKLIADAGNTYNKTGKTPSELAEERNELFEMVKSLKNCIKRLTEDENPDKDLEADWIGEAHELLQKVNGGAYWKNANEQP